MTMLPMDRSRPRPALWLAASGTTDATARRLGPSEVASHPAPTVAWRAAGAGLVVHDRFMPWDGVVSLHLELGPTGFAGLRRASSCVLEAADGERYRLEGSAEDWATLCAQIANHAAERVPGFPSPHALPFPGLSPPAASAVPTAPTGRRVAARAGWRWLTGALGTLSAILFLVMATLLFPVRFLLTGSVGFPDFVWVVPVVLALEAARLGWLCRRRSVTGVR